MIHPSKGWDDERCCNQGGISKGRSTSLSLSRINKQNSSLNKNKISRKTQITRLLLWYTGSPQSQDKSVVQIRKKNWVQTTGISGRAKWRNNESRSSSTSKGSSLIIRSALTDQWALGHYLSLEGVRHRERTGDPTEGIDDVRWYSGGGGREAKPYFV